MPPRAPRRPTPSRPRSPRLPQPSACTIPCATEPALWQQTSRPSTPFRAGSTWSVPPAGLRRGRAELTRREGGGCSVGGDAGQLAADDAEEHVWAARPGEDAHGARVGPEGEHSEKRGVKPGQGGADPNIRSTQSNPVLSTSTFSRPSNVHLDVLMGKDETIEVADVLVGEPPSPTSVRPSHPHPSSHLCFRADQSLPCSIVTDRVLTQEQGDFHTAMEKKFRSF